MKKSISLGEKMMTCKFNSLIDLINISRFSTLSLPNSDINISSGTICIDAKSIIGVTSLDISKVYNIDIITSDEDEKEKFIYYFEQFDTPTS